jgi:hypothetical protein
MLKALALAALLTTPATTAPPPPHPCIPAAQVRDTVMVIAPYLVDGIARRCAAHLPASAFLNSGAKELSARLKAESAGRQGSAAAVLRAFAPDKMPQVQDPAALVPLIGELAATMATDKIPVAQCASFSEMIAAIAPLPAENVGRLFTAIFALSGVGKDGKSPSICPDG